MRLPAQLAFDRDLEQVKTLATECRWEVRSPQTGVAEVKLTSSCDRESYWLRLRCPDYPEPCSILPFDSETGSTTQRTAWPQCEGFRPTSDLCMPLSAEGFALHPTWVTDSATAWQRTGNPLLRVLEELQFRLNDPRKYQGRCR